MTLNNIQGDLINTFNLLIILNEPRVGLSKKQRKDVIQMAIERWHPFTELMSLRQAMNRLFDDSFIRPSRILSTLGEARVPTLDVSRPPTKS
jgi:hypothetical protein